MFFRERRREKEREKGERDFCRTTIMKTRGERECVRKCEASKQEQLEQHRQRWKLKFMFWNLYFF